MRKRTASVVLALALLWSASSVTLAVGPSAVFDEPSLIANTSGLSGTNWMSGISGQRLLSEINIPGTHDSGTWSVYNRIGGKISIPVVFTDIDIDLKKFAVCQWSSIPDQLNMGVRLFDLRVTNMIPNKKNQESADTLWLCHGDKYASDVPDILKAIKDLDLCFYALDSSGAYVTLDKALGYMQDFLKEHPSETILLSVKDETGNNVDRMNSLVKAQLDTLAATTNPSTNKPYLYTQGSKNKYSAIPMLRDTRGQMLVFSSRYNSYGYGAAFNTGNSTAQTTIAGKKFNYENHYDVKTGDKYNYVSSFINTYAKNLPRDLNSQLNEGNILFTSSNVVGKVIMDYYTPREIANYVNPRFTNLLETGSFYGWILSDFVDTSLSEKIWRTNFPSDLNYSTVTYDLNRSDASPRQVKRLALNGGTFEIPTVGSLSNADFLGWFKDANGKTPLSKTEKVAQNITLYAVYNIAIKSFSLDCTTAAIEMGKTLSLKASISPADVTDQAVIWSSSDSSVATVNNGIVTGVSAGTATITAASHADSSKKAICKVVVSRKFEWNLLGESEPLGIPENKEIVVLKTPDAFGYKLGNVSMYRYNGASKVFGTGEDGGYIAIVKKGTSESSLTCDLAAETAEIPVLANSDSGVVKGDMNGNEAVTAADSGIINAIVHGSSVGFEITDWMLLSADMNHDGKVTASDIVWILEEAVGKPHR